MKLKFGTKAPAQKPVAKKKPTPHAGGRPPVSEDELSRRTEIILQYASDHASESFSVGSMGEELSLPFNIVYAHVNLMKKRGLIDNNFNKGNFTAPKAKQSEAIAKAKPVKKIKVQESKSDVPETKAPDPFVTQSEMLILTFIKETHSTNVVEYLEWLTKR